MADNYRTVYIFELQVESENAKKQIADAAREMNAAFSTPTQKIQTQGVQQATTAFSAFTDTLRETSKQYWGFRRVGYDLEHTGTRMAATGIAIGAAMYKASEGYLEFDKSATSASMAMRLSSDLSGQLRDNLQSTAEEVVAFDTSELAEGLRLWAAGTGEVVRTESQLNRIMQDTVAIEKLAAINNVDYSSTVDDVGGVIKEFGLTQKDVNHVVDILNYTA